MKLETMPLGINIDPNIFNKWGFRWQKKEMKYLGIKTLNQISQMVQINMMSLLQLIKNI